MRSPARALQLLQPALDEFKGEERPVQVTEGKIQAYLVKTADSELDAINRLIALGSSLSNEHVSGGWDDIWKIFQMAQNISDDSRPGVEGVCLAIGLGWLMERNGKPESERIKVAGTMQQILLQQYREFPHDGSLQHAFGVLDYWFPVTSKIEREDRLIHAIECFKNAIDWAEEDYEKLEPQEYLGDCYRELGQFSLAIEAYTGVDQGLLLQVEGTEACARIEQKKVLAKNHIET